MCKNLTILSKNYIIWEFIDILDIKLEGKQLLELGIDHVFHFGFTRFQTGFDRFDNRLEQKFNFDIHHSQINLEKFVAQHFEKIHSGQKNRNKLG